MKKTPWRHESAAYPIASEIWPRYSDVDSWHHVNNASVISLHVEAAQRWQREVFGETVWRQREPMLRARSLATDFVAELNYPAPVVARARLMAVSGETFRLATALYQADHCVGLHEAEFAAWHGDGTVALPAGWRDALHGVLASQPPLPADAAAATADDEGLALPDPDEAEAPRSAYAHEGEMQPRFGDRDAHGVLSDFATARYAEQARAELMFSIVDSLEAVDRVGFMVASTRTYCRRRAAPPRRWTLASAVSRLGRSSLEVRTGLFDGDDCHAVCDTVLVTFDRAQRRPTRLPEALREALRSRGLRGATFD